MTANTNTRTILTHPSANPNEEFFLFMLANPIKQIIPWEKEVLYPDFFIKTAYWLQYDSVPWSRTESEDIHFQLLTEHITMEIPGNKVQYLHHANVA